MLPILQQKLYDAAMKVNVISESAFTVQGHGVHTAFTETVKALQEHSDAEVAENGKGPADVTHIHTVGLYALRKLLGARGVTVVSAHVTPDSFVGSLVGAKYWYGLAKVYLRWFYNRADAVLAVSNEVVHELKAMGVKRPVHLMPNIIDTDVFSTTKSEKKAIRKRLGIDEKAFVVLGIGQVQPRKRADLYVKAAEALPEVEFVWAGGIPFKQLAADAGDMDRMMKLKLPNLRFTGLIERETVIEYCRAADMFWLPSTQETFGIVVVEAAAAGLPVLLRDLALYNDTFGDGYERGDDATFVKQIERFATDPDYYGRWQSVAHGIAERYDSRAGAERLMGLYREVLSNKQRH